MKKNFLFLVLVIFPMLIMGQKKMSREDYIREYKDLAMKEMIRSGVPASITLAQGILESNNGNSTLAVKGNNHFGIKCHTDWKGKKIYHNDDHDNECFRKYKSVYESFIDHSDFLVNRSRYAFLFQLDITDYEGWAKGLKKAGYATNRHYDNLLIRIIEENQLHQYDLLALKKTKPGKDNDLAEKENISRRPVRINNRIDYIIVQEGDSYESLKKELKLLNTELFRYNELTDDSMLKPGQILYLQPKRNRAEAGKDEHIVKKGESLHSISQMYGIKLEKLCEKNQMEPEDYIEPGTKLLLRRHSKPGRFRETESQKPEEREMQFQFEH